MSNSFRFKQFTILQHKCAMKVCTDACLFGAWVAENVASNSYRNKLPVARCLDVGTGTGLLSLMLAQKTDVEIDAVEIEQNAFAQAKENFANSPWSKRLKAINTDIKNHVPSRKYDLIICNPPFFENDLLPVTETKILAKHGAGLNLVTLNNIITKHLNDNGHFAILLPYHRLEYFEKIAEQNNFFMERKILIKQTTLHNFFRGILFYGREASTLIQEELIIKITEKNYSEECKKLLKEYYLNL